MRRIAWVLLLAACSTDVPSIEPAKFACAVDEPDADGLLPCPDSHWCVEGVCKPRLFCSVDGAGRPGCVPESTRCEPVFSMYTAAVRCERGVHTATSALANGDACDCADGTHCVAFADGIPADRYPLFLLPNGGAFDGSAFQVTAEVEAWRMCARGCSSEENCPPNHTCRLAAALDSPLIADPTSSRFTVGVCFPEQVVTSSSAVDPQPVPDRCQARRECSAQINTRVCNYRIERVADHPLVPAGDTWKNVALVGRCGPAPQGTADTGIGCTDGLNCKSGLCNGGACAQPCNPLFSESCASGDCIAQETERATPDGEVKDRVFVCQ